jgi:Rieske Fe-S protein
MFLNRRHFLLLTAGFAAGCHSLDHLDPAAKTAPGATPDAAHGIPVGRASDYATDGVYTRFVTQGIFLVRRNGQFFAISSICTHRQCRLIAEADHSFRCPCHGSWFTPDGHRTSGPARRDLPRYPVAIDAQGELSVNPA